MCWREVNKFGGWRREGSVDEGRLGCEDESGGGLKKWHGWKAVILFFQSLLGRCLVGGGDILGSGGFGEVVRCV